MSDKRVKWGNGFGWILIALVAMGLMFVPLAASAKGVPDHPGIHAVAANTGVTMLAKRHYERVCHTVCRRVRVPHTVFQRVCDWYKRQLCHLRAIVEYRIERRCHVTCALAVRG